jgi:hypothetical protein
MFGWYGWEQQPKLSLYYILLWRIRVELKQGQPPRLYTTPPQPGSRFLSEIGAI